MGIEISIICGVVLVAAIVAKAWFSRHKCIVASDRLHAIFQAFDKGALSRHTLWRELGLPPEVEASRLESERSRRNSDRPVRAISSYGFGEAIAEGPSPGPEMPPVTTGLVGIGGGIMAGGMIGETAPMSPNIQVGQSGYSRRYTAEEISAILTAYNPTRPYNIDEVALLVQSYDPAYPVERQTRPDLGEFVMPASPEEMQNRGESWDEI